MKKNILLIIALVLGVFFVIRGEISISEKYHKDNPSDNIATTQEETATQKELNKRTLESSESTSALSGMSHSENIAENIVVTTLPDIIENKTNTVCTLSNTGVSNRVGFDIYLGQDIYRINQRTKMGNTTVDEYILNTSSGQYIWNSENQEGIYIKYNDSQNSNNSISQDVIQSFNDRLAYLCIDWTPDSETFVVPENIEFVDATALLDKNSTPQDLCAFCDQAPDEQTRQECLEEFQCQ